MVGFFVLSGFLITGSRERSDGGRYLLNRVVRIFPGYLLVQAFVVLLLAPAAQVINTGGLGGYLGTPVTPLNYMFSNLLLKISSYGIGTTLAGLPVADTWNGSLWSLYIEFWCYIVIGVFLSWKLPRTRAWPTVLLFVLSAATHVAVSNTDRDRKSVV